MARSRVFSSIIHLQDLARKRQVPLPVLSTFRPHGPTPRMVGARERSDGQEATRRKAGCQKGRDDGNIRQGGGSSSHHRKEINFLMLTVLFLDKYMPQKMNSRVKFFRTSIPRIFAISAYSHIGASNGMDSKSCFSNYFLI